MSVKRQIGAGIATGTDTEREQRRAIVLLWTTMGATLPNPPDVDARANQGMTLAPAALPAALNDAMLKAAVVASNAGAGHIFNTQFAANPLAFIQQHRIFIHGSAAGKANFTNALAVIAQNVLNFHFVYNAAEDRFDFREVALPAINGGAHAFPTVSVPALHWSEVPGRGVIPQPPVPPPPSAASFQGIRGTELAGAAWMVTTQFTGCSFCYATLGAHTYAAHLSPAIPGSGLPALTGAVMAGQLMNNDPQVQPGRFINFPGVAVPVFNVFGNGVGNAAVLGGNPFYPPKVDGAVGGQMKWMSIFGRHMGGAWEIYSQSIDGANAILESRRIF